MAGAGRVINSCEFFTAHRQSISAEEILKSMRASCPVRHKMTPRYEGLSDVLMVWGAGSPDNANAILQQGRRGKFSVSWDYGYFGRAKRGGYLRVSLNDWHPQRWLDRTPAHPDRWERHGIQLREDGHPDGHIILVGMGPKSHKYLHSTGWEQRKLTELRSRFPDRRIIYRPKPGRTFANLDCETALGGGIDELMVGASLVVCRHSNVAVDAAVAGINFECQDGAAQWLTEKPYNVASRLDFLQRLAYWQWLPSESVEAWEFLRTFL